MTNEERNKEIERLKRIASGMEVVSMEGVDEPAGGGMPAANTAGTVAAGTVAGEMGNGYYELRDCKVVELGDKKVFADTRTGVVSEMRTIVFEYMPRKAEKPCLVCADAWNETLKYNEFNVGEFYDLSLRVAGRQSRDGRWFPVVTVAFAHRLRVVSR